MKKFPMILAFTGTLIAASAFASPQQMDPNMPGMAGMQHAAKPAEAQGVGVVKAIDTGKGTITLQHQAIKAIGWPAMTRTFRVVSPDLLKGVKVGDKVRFSPHPAGMASTITAITAIRPVQP
ncbi:MAG: copper-binding protein [Rhodanobacter sp.]|nr:MAG: copper-binding protein [Rhodanobacter sp.]